MGSRSDGPRGREQLDDPTPCAEFDVRTLLGHLIGTTQRGTATGEGRSTRPIPHVITGIADGDHAARYSAAADAAHRAWSSDGRLEELVAAPWGEVPGRDAVWGFANETLVHGWDLAVATGQPPEASPALVEPVLVRIHELVPELTRKPRVYGPAVAPPEDAGPTERLASWHGRRWPVT